jgi:hypothetical protein
MRSCSAIKARMEITASRKMPVEPASGDSTSWCSGRSIDCRAKKHLKHCSTLIGSPVMGFCGVHSQHSVQTCPQHWHWIIVKQLRFHKPPSQSHSAMPNDFSRALTFSYPHLQCRLWKPMPRGPQAESALPEHSPDVRNKALIGSGPGRAIW